MFEVHKGDDGSFQELAHNSDVVFGQLSVLTVAPGASRGGHYHTRKQEWFCCMHGSCKMEMIDTVDNSMRVVYLNENERQFVLVKPYESHTVINQNYSEACELIIIISEEYNRNDPDTIKYISRCETHGVENCKACR